MILHLQILQPEFSKFTSKWIRGINFDTVQFALPYLRVITLERTVAEIAPVNGILFQRVGFLVKIFFAFRLQHFVAKEALKLFRPINVMIPSVKVEIFFIRQS